VTLRDAATYITKLPKPEQDLEIWQIAVEHLIRAAETCGAWLMLARIGVLKALHRDRERVFNPDRKETHWGKRKLKRDEYRPAGINRWANGGGQVPVPLFSCYGCAQLIHRTAETDQDRIVNRPTWSTLCVSVSQRTTVSSVNPNNSDSTLMQFRLNLQGRGI
jgi:hypothetical protein